MSGFQTNIDSILCNGDGEQLLPYSAIELDKFHVLDRDFVVAKSLSYPLIRGLSHSLVYSELHRLFKLICGSLYLGRAVDVILNFLNVDRNSNKEFIDVFICEGLQRGERCVKI